MGNRCTCDNRGDGKDGTDIHLISRMSTVNFNTDEKRCLEKEAKDGKQQALINIAATDDYEKATEDKTKKSGETSDTPAATAMGVAKADEETAEAKKARE